MTLAPRSCPSSPGLAMTTRIGRAIAQVYERESDRDRIVPGLAEPWQRARRVPPGRPRTPASRLWAGCALTPADGRPARRRRHPDLAFPPRPLGRPRAVGMDAEAPRRRTAQAAGALASAERVSRPRAFAVGWGHAGMFEEASESASTGRACRSPRRASTSGHPRGSLRHRSVRIPRARPGRSRARVLGRLGPVRGSTRREGR